MTTEFGTGPVAVPQPVAEPAAGVNVAPPTNGAATEADPALSAFQKIAAERRSRFGEAPIEVPFGSTTIRVFRSMPSAFALDLVAATADPARAVTALRSAIIEADHELFDRILRLPPDNPEGIDGTFLLEFIKTLGEFYSGVPLGGS